MEQVKKRLQATIEAGKVPAAIQMLNEVQEKSDRSAEDLVEPLIDPIMNSYRRLFFRPVHQIYKELPEKVKAPLGEELQKRLSPEVQKTMRWARSLQSLANEREANQLRRLVREKEFERALEVIAKKVKAAKSDDEKNRAADYIGSILGSLINDQDKVKPLIEKIEGAPRSYNLNGEHLIKLKEGHERRMAAMYKEGADNIERQFKAEQSQLISDLRATLPGKQATAKQVGQEELEKFYAPLRALVGTAIASQQAARWNDLIRVLIELCPQEISTTGSQAGVEQRLYNAVSPVERMVIDKCMYELGQLPHVSKMFLKVAKSVDERHERLQANLIEIMGMLRSDVFISFILSKLNDNKLNFVAGVNALGRIGSPSAVEHLLEHLSATIKKGSSRGSLPEGTARRQVRQIISSLGQIARSSRTSASAKDHILQSTQSVLPKSDSRLKLYTALEFFRGGGGDWNQESRQWAVKTLTDSLWLSDDTPMFAGGEELQSTILGFREPIVNALIQLAPNNRQIFLDAVSSHLGEPGAAFIGVAMVAQETRDAAMLPHLERMIMSVMKAGKKSKYEQETYYDPTDRQRKPLTRDHIVSELIHAIDKIGGDESEEMMARLLEAFQEGRLERPGEDSMKVLMDARQRWSRRTGKEIFTKEKGKEKKPEPLPEETLNKLLKQLKPGLFMTDSKKAAMISAMQRLGEAFATAAIERLIDLADHKDVAIRGAARTALHRFGDIDAPKSASEALCFRLIERLETKKRANVELAKALLLELRPNREPFKSQLERMLQIEEDQDILRSIRDVIDRAERIEEESSEEDDSEDEDSEASESAEDKEDGNLHASLVDRKREYFQARQNWIKGGKKGPPPEPPRGVAI